MFYFSSILFSFFVPFMQYKKDGTKPKYDMLIGRIGLDKFNNIISVETYQRLFKTTEEDIKTANEKLEKLKEEISSINEDSSCYVEYLDIIKSFLDMKNPTREIMNRLIDKIYVTKDKKLEIHYRIKKSEVLV